jgi:hypothetical protein
MNLIRLLGCALAMALLTGIAKPEVMLDSSKDNPDQEWCHLAKSMTRNLILPVGFSSFARWFRRWARGHQPIHDNPNLERLAPSHGDTRYVVVVDPRRELAVDNSEVVLVLDDLPPIQVERRRVVSQNHRRSNGQ